MPKMCDRPGGIASAQKSVAQIEMRVEKPGSMLSAL